MELLGFGGLVGLFIFLFLVSICVLLFSEKLKIGICFITFFSFSFLAFLIYLSPRLLEVIGVINPISDVTTDQLESDTGIGRFYILNTKKHNAAALGFGNTSSIVFTTETRDKVSYDELVGISFHEKGHLVYYHSLLQIVVGGSIYFGMLFGISRLSLRRRYIVLFFSLLFFMLFFFSFAKRKEYQADSYTIISNQQNGFAIYLERMDHREGSTSRNRYENMRYIHDPLEKRIRYLKNGNN